ncbi:hypothetical protein [Variovorax sp. YR566]|uniref:hypothetical protein n=1 Tax=Variovorax sp. YR566 TaxID=3450237 RepID=UPI003F7FCFCC
MAGIYSLNTPQRLFEKLVRSFEAFCRSPSEDGIFEVIFPLYHLREWICPGGYSSYKNKLEADRSKEERLHAQLHVMPEYEVIRELCNSAKHFSSPTLSARTDVVQNLRAGHGRVGDSLGITHFTVDGKEIRDFFWPVYLVYLAYFE